MSKCREAFEESWIEDSCERGSDGLYLDKNIQEHWETWKCAWERRGASFDEAMEKVKESLK